MSRLIVNRLPWWSVDLTESFFTTEIEECRLNASNSYMPIFSRYMDCVTTMVSCSDNFTFTTALDASLYASLDEGSINSIEITQEERNYLKSAWTKTNTNNNTNIDKDDTNTYDTNIDKDESKKITVLEQHLLAIRYLLYETCNDKELTIDHIRRTHYIMMNGFIKSAGRFRETPAMANGNVFMQYEQIKPAMILVLKQFNELNDKNEINDIGRAAKLFYDIIHVIHPFEDGNGRIGRLLVSYVLMRSEKEKQPFPLPFYNGRSKARKHYECAIQHFDRLHDPCAYLRLYILECLHKYWCNYQTNIGTLTNN